jgi:integrase
VHDRPYTADEIRKMLQFADERMRGDMLLASTGMRIAALCELRLKHLKKHTIDAYLDFRRRYGDPMLPDEPVIREQFNIRDLDKATKIKFVARSTLGPCLWTCSAGPG